MVFTELSLAYTRLQDFLAWFVSFYKTIHASHVVRGWGVMYQSEWAEGSAMYYIINGPFGPAGLLKDVVSWGVDYPPVAFAMAWGALLAELILSIAPVISIKYKFYLLISGFFLHLGILIMLAISSFQITMFSAVMLLVVPVFSKVYRTGYTLSLKPKIGLNQG